MESIEKIINTYRIPNFFRDVLFAMGGGVLIALGYVIYLYRAEQPAIVSGFVSSDLNILAIFTFLSIAYFLGRINELVSLIVMDFVIFFHSLISCLQKGKLKFKLIHGELIASASNFFLGARHGEFLPRVSWNNPNEPQVSVYFQNNKVAYDDFERGIYSTIIQYHLFVSTLLVGLFVSHQVFWLSIFMIWRMYKQKMARTYQYNEIRRDIIFQRDQEINKNISALQSQNSD